MSSFAPVASVFLAVTVFEEQLRGGPGAVTAAFIGAALCVVGTAFVARSPSLVALGSAAPTAGGSAAGPADGGRLAALDDGARRGGPG